jgi:hypothetical protein
MKYSIAEAAEHLSVSPLTIRTWLNDAGIDAVPGPTDKRSRVITHEQLERLAREHNREVTLAAAALPQGADSIQSLSDLLSHVTGIESRIHSQNRHVEAVQALVLDLRDENKRQNHEIDDLQRNHQLLFDQLREVIGRLTAIESKLSVQMSSGFLTSNEG